MRALFYNNPFIHNKILSSDSLDQIKSLIPRCDFNKQLIESQQTILHCAAQGGHTELIKMFLQHGAYINAKDIYQNTPLHYAAAHSHAHAVKILLEHGADTSTKNKYHYYPANLGTAEIKGILYEYGAIETLETNFFHLTTIKPLLQALSTFKDHRHKMHIARILVGTEQITDIGRLFPYAQFTKKETAQLFQHLGYVCSHFLIKPASYSQCNKPGDFDTTLLTCTKIIQSLPLLDAQETNTIIAQLPLQEQKLILRHALQINNLCSMRNIRCLCDITFIFK